MLVDKLGGEAVDRALRYFVDEFPPLAVYQGEMDADAYLQGETAGTPNREIALEEMLMLWLDNLNPAFSPFLELFDDALLERETAYLQLLVNLYRFFETQPRFGPENQNLVDMLRAPAVAVPDSLFGQLSYIRERWGPLLGPYFQRLLSSLDLLREEQKITFLGPGRRRCWSLWAWAWRRSRNATAPTWIGCPAW